MTTIWNVYKDLGYIFSKQRCVSIGKWYFSWFTIFSYKWLSYLFSTLFRTILYILFVGIYKHVSMHRYIQSYDENGGKAIGMQTSLPYTRTLCLGLIRGRERWIRSFTVIFISCKLLHFMILRPYIWFIIVHIRVITASRWSFDLSQLYN